MESPAHFLCKKKTKTSESLSLHRTNAHPKSAPSLRKAGSPVRTLKAAKKGTIGSYKDPQITRKQVKNTESFLFSDLTRLFCPTSFILLVTPPSRRQKLPYRMGILSFCSFSTKFQVLITQEVMQPARKAAIHSAITLKADMYIGVAGNCCDVP